MFGLRGGEVGSLAHLAACLLEWHQDSGGSVWQVLRQYGVNLSEEEFFHILEYYDKTLASKISYNDFLRAFLQ